MKNFEPRPSDLAPSEPMLGEPGDRYADFNPAVVGEEDLVEIAGQDLRQRRGEIGRGLMGEAREHDMLEAARLRCERRVQLRMRVSVGAGPP